MEAKTVIHLRFLWFYFVKVLDGKEEVEKQHRENIKKLHAVVERQEKEFSKLQVNLDELHENNRSLQSALDGSYK